MPDSQPLSQSSSLRQRTPLVGRQEELTFLARRLEAASSGDGGVVLLSGEAGIGKTRLVSELAQRARDERWLVLSGQARDTGAMPPYLPFVEAIGRYMRDRDDHEAGTQLARAAPEIAHLLPGMGHLVTNATPSSALGPEADRFRLFESVSEFFFQLAKSNESTGLLLTLDDLHYADQSTLSLFQHLVHRIDGQHFLVLAAYSPTEMEPSRLVVDSLAELARERVVERLELQRLTRDQTAKLIEMLWEKGSTAVLENVFNLTNGNPFFVEEIMQQLRSGATSILDTDALGRNAAQSHTIRQVFGRRLNRLTSPALRLLEAGAVLGESFEPNLAAVISELGMPVLADSLREALAAGFLYEEEQVHRFTHPLVQKVILNSLSLPGRQALHLRAATAIESMYQHELESHLGTLSEHYRLAGPLVSGQKTLDYCRRAGDQALRMLAHEEAIRLYKAAIASGGGAGADALVDVHSKCGRAYAAIAHWSEARQEFESALRLMPGDATEARIQLLTELAIACRWVGDPRPGRHYAVQAQEMAAALEREDLLLAAKAAMALLEFSAGEISAGAKIYREAIEQAGSSQVATLKQTQAGYAHLLYLSGRHVESIEHGRAGADLAHATNDVAMQTYTLGPLGLALAGAGRYREAFETFEEARQVGTKYGVGPFLARAIAMSASPRADLFDLDRALAVTYEAREMGNRSGFLPVIASTGIDLLFYRVRRGEVGAASELLPQVEQAAEQGAGFHGWLWRLRLAELRAELALAKKDWREAVALATESAKLSHAKGRIKYEAAALESRGRALVAAGRKREGIADLRHALKVALPAGDPAMLLRAEIAILEAEPDEGVAVEADSTIRRILEQLPWDETRKCFESSSQVQLVNKLMLTGVTQFSSLLPNLSARQREVLGLIVDGKTNREIASDLVLSLRTVERHVNDIYARLGVRNRTEAVARTLKNL